jgi:Zn-dependent protease
MPLDESRLGWRRSVASLLAGPLADVVLAAVAGAGVRAFGTVSTVGRAAAVVVWVAASMAVIQCMPVPGLDGARALRWALPPRAAATYADLDQYLPLFLIVLFFVLGGTFLGIVGNLTSALCSALAGPGVC